MSTFTIILLIIILVLIASDVFFLWKISKSIGSKKKYIPDERYFELKYSINLLKAVSAILISLLGFLGFTTYQDITKIVEGDFEEKFVTQQEKIDNLDSIVKNYEETVAQLKSVEGKSIENLSDIKREFGIINNKVAKTQDALEYVPRIFVAKNLIYDESKASREMGKGVKFFYKELKTIYGESLPNFNIPPLITIYGEGANFVINESTNEYFDLSLFVSSGKPGENGKYKFGIWIVSLD